MNRKGLLMAAGALALTGRAARAAEEVVIGCIYPLTGNAAAVGLNARAVLETAAGQA